MTYSDGHYEIGLPWRPDKERLPSNLVMVERRAMALRRRLNKDSVLRRKYIETISGHISKGYISKVPPGEDTYLNRWFLPHHPVLNPNKPEKVRVVFDRAASYNGISLNQALLQGPDMTSSLVGVLLRFRRYSVAVCVDIEEMFLQVRVPVADRKALSLLWWTNEDLSGQPEVFEMGVHPFGATSSPFCANFALRQTAADNHVKY
ncbi:unnamed protein product [Calicophoron daubneyi]|uniref:Reverse transcriptase domain-containing protein n=1 Tax=Calicophoron daubneyi TaxID=300641 RepID=A0AAV2TYS7_CALDB